MDNFPVQLNLRLDWSEMDLFGHINNVSYFKYIQASRVNFWDKTGIDSLKTNMSLGPMLASTSCQFRLPLFFPGNITVESRIEFIKNTSFGIHHRILNEKREIAAEAHDVIVMFNFQANEKIRIPEELRLRLEAHQ